MNPIINSKILIVDDERTNIIALAQILKSQYEIIVAIDGNSAVETAIKQAPDLILLDIILPDISGFETLIKLKECEKTKNIPVIFITSLDSIEDEEKGLTIGAVDYITKPFHSEIVKARIATHLKISHYVKTIERLCMLDPLTELPNRRFFDNQIVIEWNNAINKQSQLSLLIIDIDFFKKYNDTYGHPQGDYLLQKIAKVALSNLEKPDDLMTRWGGEEFMVLLPNTDLEQAKLIAFQIRNDVEGTIIPNGKGVKTSVTVSIGVNTIVPTSLEQIPQFIEVTDQALYQAKKRGRNQVFLASSGDNNTD